MYECIGSRKIYLACSVFLFLVAILACVYCRWVTVAIVFFILLFLFCIMILVLSYRSVCNRNLNNLKQRE